MKYIIWLVIGVLFFSVFLIDTKWSFVNEAHAETIETTQNIFALIEFFSKKYNVPEGVLDYVVKHESSYNPVAVGDTHIICPKTGKNMRSRGLVQVSDCYHNISDYEAFNPRFAIEFLAKNLSEGRCFWWTTCIRFKKEYKINEFNW